MTRSTLAKSSVIIHSHYFSGYKDLFRGHVKSHVHKNNPWFPNKSKTEKTCYLIGVLMVKVMVYKRTMVNKSISLIV